MTCCGGGAATIIQDGPGINVSGSGTTDDPYIVSASQGTFIQTQDTSTVDLTLVGTGTADDPFLITANIQMVVDNLIDVLDPTPPVTGDTLVYVTDHWEYQPPPTQAPGAVNTGGGITGDGTVGDPIAIDVSDLVSTSTSGLATYIDSNGQLRAVAPPSTVAWANVTGKPSTFTPSAHTHPTTEVGILAGTSAPTAGVGADTNLYVQYV